MHSAVGISAVHGGEDVKTEQSDVSAGSVARPPPQEQRATAKVIRLLPQVALPG